ncbi:MAG: hypothetical protein ACK47B_05045 [Armatimonadota bacterium]
MSGAVCLRCGAWKAGAWHACRECGHLPQEPRDRARHMLVSDGFMTPAELEAAAEAVRRGEEVPLDPAVVEEQTTAFAEDQQWGRKAQVWGVVAAIVIGIGVVLLIMLSSWSGRVP